MSRKSVSCPRWTINEDSVLQNSLTNGDVLSELQLKLPKRSKAAILRRAHKNGYGSRQMIQGDICFVDEMKRRVRSNIKASTEVNGLQTTTSVDMTESKQLDVIVSKNSINNGKQLTLIALNILETNNLIITSQSVKDISDLLLQYRSKEVS